MRPEENLKRTRVYPQSSIQKVVTEFFEYVSPGQEGACRSHKTRHLVRTSRCVNPFNRDQRPKSGSYHPLEIPPRAPADRSSGFTTASDPAPRGQRTRAWIGCRPIEQAPDQRTARSAPSEGGGSRRRQRQRQRRNARCAEGGRAAGGAPGRVPCAAGRGGDSGKDGRPPEQAGALLREPRKGV